MSLRKIFPNAFFAAPASEAEIQSAEREIGTKLPDGLRALYQECNGFREPKGNAQYLLPLTGESSLVGMTLFWRRDWKEIASPDFPIDFSPYIFFGSSSADDNWAIAADGDPRIVAYHRHMENALEVVGGDILKVFEDDFALYDQINE